MKRKIVVLTIAGILAMAPLAGAAVATFEDVNMSVPPATNYTGSGGGQYYNGNNGAGGFTSGDAWFTNNYNASWGSWDGWAYSNTTDTTTAGYTNQFSAVTGGGVDGSSNYGVAFGMGSTSQIYFGYDSGQSAQQMSGFYVTNTAYAWDSMMNGDGFAKKFGGLSGADKDWFLMTVYGLDSNYARTSDSVGYYLADYRFADSAEDYIVTDWAWLDLSSLGVIYGLEFELSSSDTGAWGMNTPAYFAMDNLESSPVPVPGTIWLLGSGLIGLVGIRRRRA